MCLFVIYSYNLINYIPDVLLLGESESCLMAAKSRDKMTALSHESQTILENPVSIY